jgi:hypothetical protein
MGRRLLLAFALAAVAIAAVTAGLAFWRRDDGAAAGPARSAQEMAAAHDRADAVARGRPVEHADAPAGRREVTSRTPWRAPLRGRVVYEDLPHVGVPGVELICDGLIAPDAPVVTDREGRFEIERAIARRRITLRGSDLLTRHHLGKWIIQHKPAADGVAAVEHVWPAVVGPTFLVKVEGLERGVEPWRLRLIQHEADGTQDSWDWIDMHPGPGADELQARFTLVWYRLLPGSRFTVEVSDADGILGGEAPVPAPEGVHELELRIGVVGALLSGRVTDTEGQPIRAQVRAMRSGMQIEELLGEHSVRTDEEGRFRLPGLDPGRTQVLVASEDHALASVHLELRAGERRVQDVRLPSARIAGDVRGALIAPSGGLYAMGMLRLVCLDGEAVERIEVAFGDEEREGPGRGQSARFRFGDIPEGRYRLELVPLDGRRYEPSTLEVSPPAVDVRFVSDDLLAGDSSVEVLLRALDGRTGQPLERFEFSPRFEDLWILETEDGDEQGEDVALPVGLEVDLIVSSPGYAPACVSTADAVARGDRRVLDVPLARGPGLAVLVLDADMALRSKGLVAARLHIPLGRALAGARVRAGQRLLGTTEARGLVLCRPGAPIGTLQVSLPGWSVFSIQRHPHYEPGSGAVLVLMMRDGSMREAR